MGQAEALLLYKDSALLREAMHEDRVDVWQYVDDGAYPAHRAEKEEAERRAADLAASWDEHELADVVQRNMRCLTEGVPERLRAASTDDERARIAAFAELQSLVEDSRAALQLDALNHPRDGQPLADAVPEVHAALSRDGLARIRKENVTSAGGSLQVFRHGDHALYPHPDLKGLRELLRLLADLAFRSDLAVWVALDPYRVGGIEDVDNTLFADRWSGIELTPGNLDSLDTHTAGVESFHAAVNRSKGMDSSYPLVSTSCHWAAREDDAIDPVKRLYIREYLPPTDCWGGPLVAVLNRELHAERDTAARSFTHVDGKVRRYPVETYGVDHLRPRGAPGPHSHSRKLWRVDGQMTDEQWSDLVGLYFRGNELVSEHFQAVFPDMARAS